MWQPDGKKGAARCTAAPSHAIGAFKREASSRASACATPASPPPHALHASPPPPSLCPGRTSTARTTPRSLPPPWPRSWACRPCPPSTSPTPRRRQARGGGGGQARGEGSRAGRGLLFSQCSRGRRAPPPGAATGHWPAAGQATRFLWQAELLAAGKTLQSGGRCRQLAHHSQLSPAPGCGPVPAGLRDCRRGGEGGPAQAQPERHQVPQDAAQR